jgi:hypothetical protein
MGKGGVKEGPGCDPKKKKKPTRKTGKKKK